MAFYKAKFTDKHHSVGGILSTFLGILAMSFLIVCVRISFDFAGNGGIMLGTVGIAVFLISLSGCIIGLISFREEDKYYTYSKIGSMLCGILTVLMLGIFLIGF